MINQTALRYFLLILVFTWQASKAQDSLVKKWKFEHSFTFYSKWQMHGIYEKVKMPSAIKELRKNTSGLPTQFDTITDNPYRHGASYIQWKTKTSLRNKIVLFADLYGEHRGVSYGFFHRANTVIYPIFRVEAKDTLHFGSTAIKIDGKVGQFLNERLDEGLMIYNLDVQGFELKAGYKNLSFNYTIYGDLNNGIGLNIDDLQEFGIKVKFKKFNLGASWLIAKPPYAPLKNNYSVNLFGRRIFSNAALYAQVGYRPYSHPWFQVKLHEQLGVVAGFEYAKTTSKLNAKANIEMRFYGQAFTDSYYNLGYRYRNAADSFPQFYANTVGKYLYPLRKFETPFSQWAVFTEFMGFNISGLNISGDVDYKLNDKFSLTILFDINYLKGKIGEPWSTSQPRVSFVYPFFDAGIRYNILESLQLKTSFSNKAMNPDVHYPTHYLLNKPAFTISIVSNTH